MVMKVTVAFLLLQQAWGFPADCPNTTVIHDKNGEKWYNGCKGLTKQPKIVTMTACEEACKKDMKCSVWQMLKPGAGEGCWTGYPSEGCRTRDTTEALLKAFENDLMGGQRLQHGQIKPLADLTGVKVAGPLKKFEFKDKESDNLKKERCKMICYTDITCTVWQVTKTATDPFTCYVEHVPGHKAGAVGTAAEPTYIAGQKIEHVCPPWVPPKESGLPWPWIIAGIVLGLLAIAALVFFLQKKPKVKKTRAVKIEPKPEPVTLMYFVPQPTMLIPQQSVVMSQPVVQQPIIQREVIQQPMMTTTMPMTAPMMTTTTAPMVSGSPQYTTLR